MSLKRKAEDLEEGSSLDALHPAKRALGHIMHTGHDHADSIADMALDSDVELSGAGPTLPAAAVTGQESSSTAAVAAAPVPSSETSPGAEPDKQQQPTQSTCTDMVLYKAPTAVFYPTADLVQALLQGQLPAPQQQPNALAMLWRSLTPVQRRSLAGMWDALRDEKMLTGLLMKLPPQQQADEGQRVQAAAGSSPACIVEELEEDQHSPQQHEASCQAAVPGLHSQGALAAAGAVMSPTSDAGSVVHAPPQLTCGPTGFKDAAMTDQRQAGWQVQAQASDGSGPMDMEL